MWNIPEFSVRWSVTKTQDVKSEYSENSCSFWHEDSLSTRKEKAYAMEWENTDLELMHKEHVKVCEAQKQTCVYKWLGINNFAYLVIIREENLFQKLGSIYCLYRTAVLTICEIFQYNLAHVMFLWHTVINVLNRKEREYSSSFQVSWILKGIWTKFMLKGWNAIFLRK